MTLFSPNGRVTSVYTIIPDTPSPNRIAPPSPGEPADQLQTSLSYLSQENKDLVLKYIHTLINKSPPNQNKPSSSKQY